MVLLFVVWLRAVYLLGVVGKQIDAEEKAAKAKRDAEYHLLLRKVAEIGAKASRWESSETRSIPPKEPNPPADTIDGK